MPRQGQLLLVSLMTAGAALHVASDVVAGEMNSTAFGAQRQLGVRRPANKRQPKKATLPVTGKEPLPHLPLKQMEPMKLDGKVMRPIDMDGRTPEGKTWTQAFEELIASRLASNPGPLEPPQGKYFFDKFFCIGMMKSGTTSIHRTLSSLFGVKTQGRYTGQLTKGINDGSLEWFQHPEVWRRHYPMVKSLISNSAGFEDAPWPFLYRVYPSLVHPNETLGYIFTIRDCRKHAESSAAYNNRKQERQNTPYWISDHCARTYRRCHLHQADVYHYFAHERPDVPLNDLLIVEMSGELAQKNWKTFRRFMFGGGHAAYVTKEKPSRDHGLGNNGLDLDTIHSIPKTNGRTSWQSKQKYCKDSDFAPWENQVLDGSLLDDMSPIPMSNFCTLPLIQRNAAQMRSCEQRERDTVAWWTAHNRSLPAGIFPGGWSRVVHE